MIKASHTLIPLLFSLSSCALLLPHGEGAMPGSLGRVVLQKDDDIANVFVLMKVNGVPKKFLLDTGAPTALLFASQSELKQVAISDSAKFSDASGKTNTIYRTKGPTKIELGTLPINFNGMTAMILPPGELVKRQVAGILGRDFIGTFDWAFNFQQGTADFYRAGKAPKPAAGFCRLPTFRNAEGNFFALLKTPADGAGQRTEQVDTVEIDTGFSGTIAYPAPTEKQNTSYLRTNFLATAAVSSQADTSHLQVVSLLQLGSLSLNNLVVYQNAKKSKRMNLVGMRLLNQFDVLYYAKSHDFWLRPRTTSFQIQIKRTALAPTTDRRYVVQALTMPMPVGIHIGDTIRLGPGHTLSESALTETLSLPTVQATCGTAGRP